MRHERLTVLVVEVLETWPFSRRALARKAGVPHGTLNRIAAGTLGATPEVAGAIAGALLESGTELTVQAERLRQALQAERGEL